MIIPTGAYLKIPRYQIEFLLFSENSRIDLPENDILVEHDNISRGINFHH